MCPHVLVTNDFPPKDGGIQTYLFELWRRLPPDEFVVLTTGGGRRDTADFDRRQPFRIDRLPERVLLPRPHLARKVRALVSETNAGLVVLDPALPLGLLGRRLGIPYALVLHGAEVTVPARLPGTANLLSSVIRGASLVVAAGGYPAAESRRVAGRRTPPIAVIPPGIDLERFRPLGDAQRARARRRLGLPVEGRLVVSVSRLVPRKGMDVLIEAVGRLLPSMPDLCLAIGGAGRDRSRLEKVARRVLGEAVAEGGIGTSGPPVRFLGRVDDEDLPLLDGVADVWAMLCRNRWFGLEQEGFGIVFLEAAAAGVPQVAGLSGGAGEAVAHGETGLVVKDPSDVASVAASLGRLLEDREERLRLGRAARRRAEEQFDYVVLARRLQGALREVGG
jgi:phosphatidylinositol alpha-1,6-mannosyltransferase